MGRVVTLDLTKGVLVLFMIIYHTVGYSMQGYLAFRWLAFLPPSFILISGFLIANVYAARYRLGESHVSARLVTRGARLFALFTLLNVLAHLAIVWRARGLPPALGVFRGQWFHTYITGDGRSAAFEVLLPIAYLLLLAPALLWLDRLHRVALPALLAALLAIFAYLESGGLLWGNAHLLSAGLVGMLLGRLSVPQLKRLSGYRWQAVLAYAAFFTVGSVFGQSYLLQMLQSVSALAIVFAFCVSLHGTSWIELRLDILGRYTLLAYIVQIAALQVLVRQVGRPEPSSPEFLTIMLSTLFITLAAVEAIDWVRTRSSVMNGFYKAIFA